jgi:hypothetical protein
LLFHSATRLPSNRLQPTISSKLCNLDGLVLVLFVLGAEDGWLLGQGELELELGRFGKVGTSFLVGECMYYRKLVSLGIPAAHGTTTEQTPDQLMDTSTGGAGGSAQAWIGAPAFAAILS